MRYAVAIILLLCQICSLLAFQSIFLAKTAEKYALQSTKTKDIEHDVQSDTTKSRLDTYLASKYSDYSRSYIGTLCEQGLVLVNNKTQDKAYKVSSGDKILFTVISKTVTDVEPENIPIDIIYEDDDILAINKADGMVVHPAVGSPNGTFVNALLYHLGDTAKALIDQSKQAVAPANDDLDDNEENVDLPETPEAANASPAALRPGIVHRLDKGTTGVLIAAKHPMALDKVSKLFAQRRIRKVYLAVCVGHPGDTTIVEPIGRSPKNRQLMCTYDGPPGKPAVTHTRTLCFDGKLSLVLVRIETGRTHQIRVHLKERRTPILGDDAYGNGQWNKQYIKSHQVRRPLLHAYETEFIHPFTNKPVLLRAPLPADFQRVIKSISGGLIFPQDLQVFDEETKLLLGSTEVAGRDFSADDLTILGKNSGNSGLTPIRMYVPSERLKLAENEDDWLKMDLSEDPSLFL